MDRYGQPTQASCTGMSQHMQIVKNTLWHEKCVFFYSFGFLLMEEKEQRHAVPGICEVIFCQCQLGEKKPAIRKVFLGLFLQAPRKWLERS